MRITRVKHHRLKQISAAALEGYRQGEDFRRLRQDPIIRSNWIAFTELHWNAGEGCLYVGLTAYDGDIFYRFWPEDGSFESLGFHLTPRDPQCIKVHRGLTFDGEGGYYFGCAGLPDLDERSTAPGGSIFHFRNGEFEYLGTPVPHDYIQCIEVDLTRRRIYGVSDPVTYFFDYDLDRRETRLALYTGSHFHEPALDDDGYLWGSWSARRGHCLFRYHPDAGEPEYFRDPIPNLGLEHAFNFAGNGPIDSFINGGDGYLYLGTTLGELYRLEPKSARLELLGRPAEGIRLSGLMVGPEGKLLGSYGAYDQTGVFLYDRQAGTFSNLGPMRDEEAACFLIHEIAWDGAGRVYAAETDNVDRSSYLWEAWLE